MKYLSVIFVLITFSAYGQKTYVIPVDSTKLTTVNGTGNELIIENDTKDSSGAVLANIANGRTNFQKLRLQRVDDTTFRMLLGTTVQGQTISIPVSSYGSSSARKVDTILFAKNAGGDSVVLTYTINETQYRLAAIDNNSGGGVGTNIYNSDGAIDTGVQRHVLVDGSALEIYDPTDLNSFSIGDSFAIPDPGGGEHIHLPMDGVKMTKYYIGGGGTELADVTYSAQIVGGSLLTANHSAFDFITSTLTGFVVEHPLGSQEYTSAWRYYNPTTDETLSIVLEQSDSARAGFLLSPLDETQPDHRWKPPYMFCAEDTLANIYFGLKTAGKIFVDAPVNNSVTKIIGWDDTDSTLTITDMPGGGGGSPYALTKTADSLILDDGTNRSAVKDEGWILLSSATASSVAAVEFTIDTTIAYTELRIVGYDIILANGNAMHMRLGFGSTPTYASGASDYAYSRIHNLGNETNAASSFIFIQNAVYNDAAGASGTYPLDFTATIKSPNSTDKKKMVFSRAASNFNSTPGQVWTNISAGRYVINNRPIAGIQLTGNGSNILAGTFKIYYMK